MKRPDVASTIEMPLLGETYTLHQAIAWIAFADPDQKLDLAPPEELLNINFTMSRQQIEAAERLNSFTKTDDKTGLEVLNLDNLLGRSTNPHISDSAIWMLTRLKRHEVVSQAVAKLEHAITSCTFALDGWQLIDGRLNGLGSKHHNPIPVVTRMHECRIPLDYLPIDGGRLLFITGTDDLGWDTWIAYRDVRILRSAAHEISTLWSFQVNKPSQDDINNRAKLYMNECMARAYKPTRKEIQINTGATEDQLRTVLKTIPAKDRHGSGAPPTRSRKKP